MKITAIQKFKVLGFTALLGLGLIACGGGGVPGVDIPDVGSSTSSGGSTGTIRVTNSTSSAIGFVYVRTSGTTAWGDDLTNGSNGASGTSDSVSIAPGEVLINSSVACDRYIDIRAEDYGSGYAQRNSYYFSCGTTFSWTVSAYGGSTSSSTTSSSTTSSSTTSSSTTSSGGSAYGDSVHVWVGRQTNSGTISVRWDGSTKGSLGQYYSTGSPTTCGVDTGSADVVFTSTTGSHTLYASDSSNVWPNKTFTKNTGTCLQIELL